MTMVGGITGVFYGALRSAIPGRLRLPLWVTVWACFGGASIVHDDGVDFTLVEPALLSIVLFVALPGIGAGVVVLLVERWQRAAPWRDRRLTALLVVASLASTFALIFAALVAAAALLLRRLPELPRAGWAVLRVAVPALLGLAAIVAGVDLLQESSRILD
jgi:Na+/citrate or Na+/malate symporter